MQNKKVPHPWQEKMEVKMKRMIRVIAFSALAALSLTLNPIQAGAYGETTEKKHVDSRHKSSQ